jgi:hypothetical protein
VKSFPRRRLILVVAAAAGWPVWAQDGITAPAAGWLWPQIQARITLQTAALSPLAASSLAHPVDGSAPRGLTGGGVFGDYVFARPSYGSFRATSGLLLGQAAGAPVLSTGVGSRLDLTLLDGAAQSAAAFDGTTMPYLGFGYSSPALWGGLSVSADLGLAAGRLSGVGRALAGQQAWDQAVREMRLTPLLQLGVRYAF